VAVNDQMTLRLNKFHAQSLSVLDNEKRRLASPLASVDLHPEVVVPDSSVIDLPSRLIPDPFLRGQFPCRMSPILATLADGTSHSNILFANGHNDQVKLFSLIS
jgi:hypothetical protein